MKVLDRARSLPDFPITASDTLSNAARAAGLPTFHALAVHVEALPYGRLTRTAGWEAVLTEGRGTCSSKHALLAAVAATNGYDTVQLMLGIYAMSEATTPVVGAVLAAAGIAAVPEAHCYLRYRGVRVDLTGLRGGTRSPFDVLIDELVVSPHGLAAIKEARHRAALTAWAQAHGEDAARLWAVREACIAALSDRAG